MKLSALTLCLLIPFALIACDQTGPAAPPETPATPATSSPRQSADYNAERPAAPAASERPADPTVASFLGIEAPKPATWQWQPPRNPMITTNYTVPAPADIEGAKAAHLNVYFFGEGMGGPIEDNIVRWQSQFRSPDGYAVEPIVDEFEVDSMPVTFVELAGEWMQMGASWFTRDQLFLAAIVDAPAGRIFIRFAGDEKTIEANRESFMAMIHGMRRVADEVNDPGAPYDTGGY